MGGLWARFKFTCCKESGAAFSGTLGFLRRKAQESSRTPSDLVTRTLIPCDVLDFPALFEKGGPKASFGFSRNLLHDEKRICQASNYSHFLSRGSLLSCSLAEIVGCGCSGAPVATVSRGPDYHSVDRAAAVR